MQKNADIFFQDEKLFVKGDVDFSNVMSLFRKSLPHIKQCNEVAIDFSQLASSNSSGLALVIEWIRFAKKLNKPIHFSYFPTKLLSIAKVASLEQLINFHIL